MCLMTVAYLCTQKAPEKLSDQKSAIEKWLLAKGIKDAEWIFDDIGPYNIGKSEAFAKLIRRIGYDTGIQVVSFDIHEFLNDLENSLKQLLLLTAQRPVIIRPGSAPTSLRKLIDLSVSSSLAGISNGDRIKQGLQNAKAKGTKVGAKKGAQHRLGWRKNHDQELIEKVSTLLKTGSLRKVSEELGVSPATVLRIKRRYLDVEVD